MRRIAAFCLTICMLLALCAPASAEQTQFRDFGRIDNRSEVTLLVALGLISGYTDGSFQPNATISRAETAKLIALLCTDAPTGGSGQFTDLDGSWATDYILYCAERDIIAGNGNGLFRPQDSVTGQELAKMLLVVVGQDAARYVGPSWAANVNADAAAYGIYDRFHQDPAAPIDRDDACLLIYNAMQCLAVVGYDNGAAVYATDALMNPITYLEQRFGVVRYTSVLTGNEYADLTVSGGKLDQGLSKIAGHKEFSVTTGLSLVGRCVDIYVRDGQVIGTPCVSSSAVSYTFTSKSELEQLCQLTDYSLAPDAVYYYNFDPSTSEILDRLPNSVEITVLDQDGDQAFEQILVVPFTAAVVEQAEPLHVRLDNGSTVAALAYQSGDDFKPGQQVQCVQVGGQWFVK